MPFSPIPRSAALYDQYGHSGVDQKFRQEDIFRGTDFRSVFEGGEGGFGGVFETLFGDLGFDLFGTRGRKRRHGPEANGGSRLRRRGPFDVTLEEAFRGTEKTVTIPGDDTCGTCGGTGELSNGVCPTCGGSGRCTPRARCPSPSRA